MARIIGVEVPPNKRIDIALRYIYGIGPVNALEILERANIDRSIRAKDLTEMQLSQIVHAIQEGKYVIEGHGVDPDIEVENDPADTIEGRDPQLERAIAEIEKALQANPKTLPQRPPDPDKSPKR